MSELVVGSIAGLASNDYVVEVASGSQLTQPGMVLQVVSTTKTDTFSANTSQGTFTDVTGLSATITPSSSSSKIMVICTIHAASGDTTTSTGDPGGAHFRLLRDSTPLGLADSGGTYQATFGVLSVAGLDTYDSRVPSPATYTILDSPATTSATTYKIAGGTLRTPNNTFFVNRSENDFSRTSSTITLMEIAG